ncbi:MAG: type II toxin-antitoxin system HicB family antitoxin [Acidobacteriota bacterium]|jgi:predicted RNase H-like HicB family nuclease|uniref:Antitoxin HicB n=1 Tax=Thermoanaerobaculum aquaticum TaxID=1312852 RepID=A0A062XLU0_9BACT|nr:type II toxin-antitoxin system HicB family antitoxin [Thermoanaerobaculum aquaticum]KDA53512.1 antitoxin HicB [Thermoanaerobaculum aquaticum]BCW93135.1 MAG: HicB family protein [Thermoanaerobaculum sp.]
MRVKVVLEASEEGGYTVYVPSLPGCISEGETVEEALRNIREAIELYLEPVDDDLVMEEAALVQEIEV